MSRLGYRQPTRVGIGVSVPIPRGAEPAAVRLMPLVALDPSQPDQLGSQGVVIRLPGANFPPAGSIAVDAIGDGSILPGASATLVTVVVPDTLRFRMMGIGFGADDEVALRFLTWSIRSSGDTVPGYFTVSAAVGSIRQLSEIFYLVGSSSSITIVATADVTMTYNAFALPYRFYCRVRGHFYSEKEGA